MTAGSPTTTIETVVVAERLATVRDRIAAAGGNTDDVVVVAVTKGFGPDAVAAAGAAGLTEVGENFAQELAAKWEASGGVVAGRHWHFLGRVQRNKVRSIAPAVELWQGVDREEAGREIARRAPGAGVLVQVSDGHDGSSGGGGGGARNGCAAAEVPALVEALEGLGLQVRGLMAVGPNGPPELARRGFREVSALAERLGLAERSMGMSADLEVAVEEGSTMVRVGRALFGPRPLGPRTRR